MTGPNGGMYITRLSSTSEFCCGLVNWNDSGKEGLLTVANY